ncbi:MAG: methanogenesis marker protein Mmp4/MtxX [Promethearchaeota archaeon]|nr:MAG: methanogenesis marker protein Mmp4/MtxX [Candidatus Lokiarchaeota archaeon]
MFSKKKPFISMKIIQKYELAAKAKNPVNIGIGIGDNENQNQKILKASLTFLKKFKSNLFFFGKKDYKNSLIKQTPKSKVNTKIKYIDCEIPEKSIIDFLIRDNIHSIVRGSISSNKFLNHLKKKLNNNEIHRLAILETFTGDQFFYGPVGIDECNNLNKKRTYIELALKELRKVEITPKISILSGGRLGDVGRDSKIDQLIQDGDEIVKLFKDRYSNLMISHDEILIENAVESKSNLIIAPDGVSGNLIYRTLVHLGGGKAYGAIYMGIPRTIIDTSRVGNQSEIYGALILALALSNESDF